jgi:hypothetical protein
VLGLEVYKDRRCSSCTDKDKLKYGCDTDVKPFFFDKEYMTRCPLRPYKDDPQYFSELFKLYSFKEKSILPEAGGYYDQPNFYTEAMLEMDSAISDSYTAKEDMKIEEDKKLKALGALGINFTPKK